MEEKYSEILSVARKEFRPLILDDGAKFLMDFCKEHKPKDILEIGTAVGYSASLMLDCIENAKVTTIEVDEKNFYLAKQNFERFGYSNRVEQILGDAGKVILEFLNQKKQFDFIFLDGPKGQYAKYLPTLLKLLKKGGYLMADNVLFKGKVRKEGFIEHKHRTIVMSLRKFIYEIENNPELESKVYEIGDGISLSKKIWFYLFCKSFW